MGRLVHQGQSVRVTVPASTTVNQGDLVMLDGFFGLAFQKVVTGVGETAPLILNVEQGVYETTQITTADAFAKGDKVYWDNATKLLTTAPANDASGHATRRLVGRVETAKANGVVRLLLGPQAVEFA